MAAIMKCFEENSCRLCAKTFCCIKCRRHHEEEEHNVNPECEICIYGRTTIKEASVSLLSHIKVAHWPLHCVFCKKVFTTFDELVPHDKCTLRVETLKLQRTPKTPVTPDLEGEEPSPEVTPFYKCIKGGTQFTGSKLSARAVTSTPLVHKDDAKCDKITPVNQNLSTTHKSNLKLTGSSNLSDLKKSERRVTFSETPSIAEPYKKPKYLPLAQKSDDGEKDAADDSIDLYASVDEEEEYKTAPGTHSEEKENIDNELAILEKCNSDATLWESAMTKLEVNTESICDQSTNFNVSLQINVFNNNKSDDSSDINVNAGPNVSLLDKSVNIWSSVTNIMKSVVSNISMTAQNSFSGVGLKRLQPDNDEAPSLKRMKLIELKCRRPIRDVSPYGTHFVKPKYVDKATQTDKCWM